MCIKPYLDSLQAIYLYLIVLTRRSIQLVDACCCAVLLFKMNGDWNHMPMHLFLCQIIKGL